MVTPREAGDDEPARRSLQGPSTPSTSIRTPAHGWFCAVVDHAEQRRGIEVGRGHLLRGAGAGEQRHDEENGRDAEPMIISWAPSTASSPRPSVTDAPSSSTSVQPSTTLPRTAAITAPERVSFTNTCVVPSGARDLPR